MSGPTPLPCLTCRTCGSVNRALYFTPVAVDGSWLDRDDSLMPEVAL